MVRGTSGPDIITVRVNPANTERLQVRVNDQWFGFDRQAIQKVRLAGRGGDDFLGVNPTGGALGVPSVLVGGRGRDTLVGGGQDDILRGNGGQNILLGQGQVESKGQSKVFRDVRQASIRMPWQRTAGTRALNNTDITLTGNGPFLIKLNANGTVVDFFQNGSLVDSEPLATLGGIAVNAGSGNDVLTLDFSIANVIPAGITFDGGSGNDVLEIVGQHGAGTVTIAGGSVKLAKGSFLATDDITFDVTAGTLTFEGSQRIQSLDIGSGASAAVATGGGRVLVTNSLTIAGSLATGVWTGALDLNDNDLIIDYSGASPETTLISQLSSGINMSGTVWLGTGIRSSSAASRPRTALGQAEAATLGVTTFAGVDVDSTALLVRYTYSGDANLNLQLDANDYFRLYSNWGSGKKSWSKGNFNYDGSVNGDDVALLDQASLMIHPPTGSDAAATGTTYTLALPSGPTGWSIDWGDGSPLDTFGTETSRTHTFTTGNVLRGIDATATYSGGTTFRFVPVRVDVDVVLQITDLSSQGVPEQVMEDVYIGSGSGGTYTVPAMKNGGRLADVGIAPPEDTGSPFVQSVHYDAQINGDGSVTLSFLRAAAYVIRTTYSDNGSDEITYFDISVDGGWSAEVGKGSRDRLVKIPTPTSQLVLVDSARGSLDNGYLKQTALYMATLDKLTSFSSIADAVQKIQARYIQNNLRPITVTIISHGLPGAIGMGSGTGGAPGDGKGLYYNDPNGAANLNSFINGIAGKVSKIDFYACKAAGVVFPDDPTTTWTDDGPALMRQIAGGTGAIVGGYDKETAGHYNALFGGAFYVLEGGTYVLEFP